MPHRAVIFLGVHSLLRCVLSKQPWLAQIRKGLIEFCILEVIHQDGESYGYAIMRSLDHAQALRFNESAVYRALGRLLKSGALSCRHGTSDTGRKRRYFKLTPQGYEHLNQIRQDWTSLTEAIALLQGGKL